MKVLLIVAATDKWWRRAISDALSTPPIGLLSIAQFLRMHSHEVSVVDFLLGGMSKEEFAQKVFEINPQLVGISVYTESYNSAIDIAKTVKHILPRTKLAMGGPHVTFTTGETLSNPEVDYVVLNEGEMTVLELVEHLQHPQGYPVHRIKGLAYRDDQGVHINEKRPFIDELDALPFPAYDLVPRRDYRIPFAIMSSRGCPGRCLFCASRVMSGSKYRMRSEEDIFSEVYYFSLKEGRKRFVIFDDTFTVSVKRVEAFCNLLLDSGLDLRWRCESRADNLSKKILRKMKQAGCHAIHFGVESGNQAILDSTGKNISLSKVEELVSVCQDIGLTPVCSFILGHHKDTPQTMTETLALCERFKTKYGASIAISANTPYPGTTLYEKAEKLKVRILSHEWDDFLLSQPIISVENAGVEEIRKLLFEAYSTLA